MDQYSSDTGNLNVIVTGTDSYSPLSSATIEIANTGEPNRILESVNTDRNGQTGNIELSALSTENRRAGDQAFIRKWRDRPLTRRRPGDDRCT